MAKLGALPRARNRRRYDLDDPVARSVADPLRYLSYPLREGENEDDDPPYFRRMPTGLFNKLMSSPFPNPLPDPLPEGTRLFLAGDAESLPFDGEIEPGNPLYIFCSEEYDFLVVAATDKEDAVKKYIHHAGIRTNLFLEDVYERKVDLGFSARFWIATEQEEEAFATNDGQLIATHADFAQRVEEFFAPRPEFGALYIQHYDSEEPEEDAIARGLFPDEMLIYIYENRGNWANLDALPVEDIQLK